MLQKFVLVTIMSVSFYGVVEVMKCLTSFVSTTQWKSDNNDSDSKTRTVPGLTINTVLLISVIRYRFKIVAQSLVLKPGNEFFQCWKVTKLTVLWYLFQVYVLYSSVSFLGDFLLSFHHISNYKTGKTQNIRILRKSLFCRYIIIVIIIIASLPAAETSSAIQYFWLVHFCQINKQQITVSYLLPVNLIFFKYFYN